MQMNLSVPWLIFGIIIGSLLGFNASIWYSSLLTMTINNDMHDIDNMNVIKIRNIEKEEQNTEIRVINSESEYEWCLNIIDSYKNDSINNNGNSYGLHYKGKGTMSGKYNFESQYHQDWILYSAIFINMKYIGIYMDLAANRYRKISNTFFFDKCLSWNGICIDAESSFWNDLRMRRNCILIDKCIWNETKQLIFQSAGSGFGSGVAGIRGFNKLKQRNIEIKNEIIMNCTTIQHIADKYNIKKIDYLSLDIEGAELYALKGIDFDRLQIDVLTLEGNEKESVNFLINHGFIKTLETNGDFIFIHKNAKDKLKWMLNWIENANWKQVDPNIKKP